LFALAPLASQLDESIFSGKQRLGLGGSRSLARRAVTSPLILFSPFRQSSSALKTIVDTVYGPRNQLRGACRKARKMAKY